MNKFNLKEPFNYVDICAGIGGFHQAMSALGGNCVGAYEIDKHCIATYKNNFFGTPMLGDISKRSEKIEESIDVLCAGFPCQPFSKAGKRLGFEDEGRGQLFYDIVSLINEHEELSFIILENVRNLADQTENWNAIVQALESLNFFITKDPLILSPSDFGIPQYRERVFILGIRKGIEAPEVSEVGKISLDMLGLEKFECEKNSAFSILDGNVSDELCINGAEKEVLEAWEEFFKKFKDTGFPHPVWLAAMGIGDASKDSFFALKKVDNMPDWKKRFFEKNRMFYEQNCDAIDNWNKKYGMTSRKNTFQKFEWNCGSDVSRFRDGIIQFRQSGVRVKRPNYFPALVALVNTPIVWDETKEQYRYLSVREAAKLQSFSPNFSFPSEEKQAYKQLGNAVNVTIVSELAKCLFKLSSYGESHVKKD